METFKTYITDINNCLQEILDIFSLQEVILKFDLLDDVNAIDQYGLVDKAENIFDRIVYKNQSIGDLPEPTRQYYDFKGWFLNFEKDEYYTPPKVFWSNEVKDFSKVITNGNVITLYAKWDLKTIDVQLDPCGGSVFPESISIKYFEPLEKELSKVQISKKNSKFENWTTNTNVLVNNSTVLTPGIDTLFALYEEKPCKIKFSYNYGNIKGEISNPNESILCANISSLENLKIGDTFNLAEDEDISGKNFIQDTYLTAKGYEFKGWSLLKNNPDVQFTVFLNEDTTLYAYWEPISYNINYKYKNNDNDSPIFIQKLQYGAATSLVPYKTIFNEEPLENFVWKRTQVDHEDITLKDNELVENLLSLNNGNVTLFRDFYSNNISTSPYKIENFRKYANGEVFQGIDFNMFFNDGSIYHPSKIVPEKFSNNGVVTCFLGENISGTCNVFENIDDFSLLDVTFELSGMKTKYEYGEKFDLNSIYVIEKYSNGTSRNISFRKYQNQFITFPDKQTVLKKSGTIFFGYKSITDGTIWPNVDGNKAMWACTAQSKNYEVSSGEKSIVISHPARKLSYIQGEKLNLNELELMLEMTTQERFSLELSNCIFSPNLSDNLELSDTTISIQLSGNTSVSTSYEINIREKQVESFFLKMPSNFNYIYPKAENISEENISTTIDISDLDMTNVSVIVNYDSKTSSEYLFDDLSNEIELIANNLSIRYGEIDINVYFSPKSYNLNGQQFYSSFEIKKRFPKYLLAFKTNSSINNVQKIHSLSCINNNFEISLECFDEHLSKGGTIKEVFFSNNGKFDENIEIKTDTYKYFQIRSNDVENLSAVDNFDNYVSFNKNIMDSYPEILFINQNISGITSFVPPYTFYNSTLNSIDIGEKTTFVDDFGFYNDINLSSITFPENISFIGENAFSFCGNLLSMEFKPEIVPNLQINSFGSNASDFSGNEIEETDEIKRLIIYPTSSYVNDNISSEFSNFKILGDPTNRPGYTYILSALK